MHKTAHRLSCYIPKYSKLFIQIVRETSVRESDCPGNVRYPDSCRDVYFKVFRECNAVQANISKSIIRAGICELDNIDMVSSDKKEMEIFTGVSVFGGPVGCDACAAAFPEVNEGGWLSN